MLDDRLRRRHQIIRVALRNFIPALFFYLVDKGLQLHDRCIRMVPLQTAQRVLQLSGQGIFQPVIQRELFDIFDQMTDGILKSPTTTALGLSPTANSVAGLKLPAPSPHNTETVCES